MDVLQLVFAFVNAPLFATFLLGMFWRRTTGHGAFFGLLTGTAAAAAAPRPIVAGGTRSGDQGRVAVGAHHYPSEMAQNFWTAIWAFSACFIATVGVSWPPNASPTRSYRPRLRADAESEGRQRRLVQAPGNPRRAGVDADPDLEHRLLVR